MSCAYLNYDWGGGGLLVNKMEEIRLPPLAKTVEPPSHKGLVVSFFVNLGSKVN